MSLLVTVTGPDHPGVTASLMEVLAAHGSVVHDIEQVVVHDRLLLGIVIAGDGPGSAVMTALEQAASAAGVEVEFEHLEELQETGRTERHHVVVLGAPLPPAALAAVARRLAACGANIERVTRLSSWPAQSFELLVAGGDTTRLRSELAAEAVSQRVDVAVERASIYRRAKRLVVMDVDSTLVQGEVIEMLAAEAGCEAEVARVTAAAMAGELDFEESLRARVRLLEGLSVEAVDRVRASVQLTPGARTRSTASTGSPSSRRTRARRDCSKSSSPAIAAAVTRATSASQPASAASISMTSPCTRVESTSMTTRRFARR